MIKAFSILWLVILIPIALVFSPFGSVPLNEIGNSMAHKFYTEVYGPTLYTLEDDLLKLPKEEWKSYSDELQPEFGHKLDVVSIVDFPFTDSNKALISDGEMIYHIGDPPALMKRVGESDQAVYFAVELAVLEAGKMAAKGPLHLLRRQILELPKEQREEGLRKLTETLPVIATFEKIDSVKLSEEEQRKLLAGEIAAELSENDEIVFYALIEEGVVLKIFEHNSTKLQLQFSSYIIMGIMACIAAGMFLWAIPLWRDLKRLAATTNAYGRGELQSRAKISRMSVVAQLSGSFNKMADNIEKLILGHRELTNAIAHDLRTPLYRLRFAFEMLNDNKLSDEQRAKYNGVVEKSIDDLDHLINQTLILSRYSRVPSAEQIAPCILEPVLRSEINHFQLEHPELSVSFQCSSLLKESEVIVDQRAMIRALNNLLANAARFAEETIQVTLERHPNNWVLIVEDDGIGIPQDMWQSIFDPFTQVNNEQRDTSTGHGLGLAIVKQIAHWHEGEANVSQSELGGAKFIITWNKPLTSDSPNQAQAVTNRHISSTSEHG
ncbi:ATP-binding protein [Vibrio nigripulchritudo]|uniref:ATP-binding protein n=1 Tax=Vibrio nigripulchritudo TaxID=28173 RepID=UPI0003B1A612|nr:ATP-binding protein [Vibrio nigripulchritudo]CCN73485.1 putative SENSORY TRANSDUCTION HISTIDINE KINASE [Vibrio nigripulchritudo SFn118]